MRSLKRYANKLLIFMHWIEIRPYRTYAALRALKRYRYEYAEFISRTKWNVVRTPCLFDRDQESGTYGEYFWQDLFVAKRIIEQNPKRHIDVGSRVDGFIAHLACVRNVEVLDIRPISAQVEKVNFYQEDISKLSENWFNAADCLSCLHTLEHFGLGRYGDEIDPNGWMVGLNNLQKILKKGGVFWLSVPIGKERVEFNAHRIFNPRTICDYLSRLGLELTEFGYLANDRIIISNDLERDFNLLANIEYSLGIFRFAK
jgi:hypothetical protein